LMIRRIVEKSSTTRNFISLLTLSLLYSDLSKTVFPDVFDPLAKDATFAAL